MSLVIDTDIVSYIFKQDSRAELYLPHLIGLPKFISFMSFAELRLWKQKSNWGALKKTKFEKFLGDFGIIYADEKLCNIWVEIKLEARKKGKPIETADAWIAAVALMFDTPLVTHNRKHFENISRLKLISEN